MPLDAITQSPNNANSALSTLTEVECASAQEASALVDKVVQGNLPDLIMLRLNNGTLIKNIGALAHPLLERVEIDNYSAMDRKGEQIMQLFTNCPKLQRVQLTNTPMITAMEHEEEPAICTSGLTWSSKEAQSQTRSPVCIGDTIFERGSFAGR